MRDNKLHFLVQTAVFTVIIAVLAQLAIPMPSGISITLQTFAVALCGFFIGPIQAVLSVILYILIGGIGIPVFANLHGGLSFLTGSTGGFIIGFIPLALLCGLAELIPMDKELTILSIIKTVIALFIASSGLIACHILGAWHFANFTKRDIFSVLPLVSYPFLIKDFISVIAAYFLAASMKNKISSP